MSQPSRTRASTTTPTAGTPAAAAPANPVPVLKATGATPAPGTVYGNYDVYGDRYASGSFRGGEQVIVYTCADEAAFLAEQGRVPHPDDSHGVITIPGKLTVISTTGVLDVTTGGQEWGGPDPAQIALKVGGLVITPQN